MGVVDAPVCNSGLSVSHLREDFETLPRCRSGWGMPPLPPRDSMSAGRVDRRRARRLRWNTKEAQEKYQSLQGVSRYGVPGSFGRD
jgi:hypothetical protein